MGSKTFFFSLYMLLMLGSASAQLSNEEMPRRNIKLTSLFSKVEDSLKHEFKVKGLEWPARYMFIRSFKYEKQLEVWVKNQWNEPFRMFKIYKVCASSGTFGPKRREGDRQIPEGFYYINEFKPNSNYHLALGINYPNASDQLLSDPNKPGGEIYIHGNCVTVGCLPLTDSLIEQVYHLASVVRNQGQDFIPVHIYPHRFDHPASRQAFLQKTQTKPDVQQFSTQLHTAYDFFEDTHLLPAILIDHKGGYVVATDPQAPKVQRVKIIEPQSPKDPYEAVALEEKPDVVPLPKNGNAALQKWLFQLSNELIPFLEGRSSVSVQVEFIVDSEGNTKLVRILKGGTASMNPRITERFERELKWTPALKSNKAVQVRMKQNINIAAPEDL